MIGGGAKNMSAAQMEEYNNAAFKEYNEVALVPCPTCGRTFLPDRLAIHYKSCAKSSTSKNTLNGSSSLTAMAGASIINQSASNTPQMGASTKAANLGSPSVGSIKGPQTVVCHLW